MRTSEHTLVTARRGVAVHLVGDRDGIAAAVALLDVAEEVAGAPLVDEAERARLDTAHVDGEAPEHWHALVALDPVGVPTAYVGLVTGDGDVATGDVAVRRDAADGGAALGAAVDAGAVLAGDHEARGLRLWLRHATDEQVACVSGVGFEVERRLGVLRRDLDLPRPRPLPAGVSVRAFRPGSDDAAVTGVLRAAYEGTADGGWTEQSLRDRTAYDWFDPADLLVAEDADGEVLGVHWTKRRGGGVGEVYNLAVAPTAQGRGLGGALLDAGLAHLADVGCDEVILWVDRANERGVALYGSHGFTTAWDDVAFWRPLT